MVKGERRSTKRGTSVEFADYRSYTRGDDLRRLDWNIYARLDRPFIKLLEEEEDLAVHLLLDSSASMDWPRDGEKAHKFGFARGVIAALGYIGLIEGDTVSVTSLSGREWKRWGPHRGRAQALGMFDFLGTIEPSGDTALNPVLKAYAMQGGRAGLCVLVSDMFSPDGYLEGLDALLSRGHELVLIHILSPDEIDPPMRGDLRLIDSETEAEQDVTLDEGVRMRYRRRLEAWLAEIAETCRGRDVRYIRAVSDSSWERLVLYHLRRVGILR